MNKPIEWCYRWFLVNEMKVWVVDYKVLYRGFWLGRECEGEMGYHSFVPPEPILRQYAMDRL